MSKNYLHAFESGMEDSLMDEVVSINESTKMMSKNKMAPSRTDMKRTRTSFIAAKKKAAKKSVNTEEIEELNASICGKKKQRR